MQSGVPQQSRVLFTLQMPQVQTEVGCFGLRIYIGLGVISEESGRDYSAASAGAPVISPASSNHGLMRRSDVVVSPSSGAGRSLGAEVGITSLHPSLSQSQDSSDYGEYFSHRSFKGSSITNHRLKRGLGTVHGCSYRLDAGLCWESHDFSPASCTGLTSVLITSHNE